MLFTGQTRSKPAINLGGNAAGSSAEDPRQARQLREQQRRYDASARKIQAWYRARCAACAAKDAARRDFDALEGRYADASASSSSTSSNSKCSSPLLQLTALLVFAYTENNAGDAARLTRFARHAASPVNAQSTSIHLFQALEVSSSDEAQKERWRYLLCRLARIMIRKSATQPL